MERKQLICVNCPKGCHITVDLENGKPVNVSGYTCEQGKKYAMQETIDPMRVLTSTVKLENGTLNVLPVITEHEIPLRLWKIAMKEISKVSIKAPVKQGQIIIEDFLHTGVNLLSSRTVRNR